jgi:alpha-L-fucosidase 2
MLPSGDLSVEVAAILAGVCVLVLVLSAQQPPRLVQLTGTAPPPASPLSLWYRAPASDRPLDEPRSTGQGANQEWVRALPVGNGRLGAMVFGGVVHERLQLNEDTLWAGRPYDPVNPEAREAVPEVRRLLTAGQYREAASLVSGKVMAKPLAQMPYQTLGDLALTFPQIASVENYRRVLDLATATARVSYMSSGVAFEREVFASKPHQVIVVRLTANRPGQISFEARMQTPQRASIDASDGDLVMRGVNGDGRGTTADGRPMTGALRFEARVRIVATGGIRTSSGGAVVVRGADAVTLLIAAATSYRNYDDVSADPAARVAAALASASLTSIDALRAAHVRDYQQLFNRVSLHVGPSVTAPTDERVRGFAAGEDPDLSALYFQYGRYLLIASSRTGSQPANLQGIWNDSMSPPWGSKYTININTEMNYWPALSTNLAETMDPLTAMVSDLTVTGARTARTMYGAGGWVAHHNTDLWRATAPIDGPQWGMWPTGGAWLTLALWDRYEYTGDRTYLRTIYPMLKGAAQFFLDTLVDDPSRRWLVTSPSLSPENPHPFGTSLAMGPTMDQQILRDLFSSATKAARVLGLDRDLQEKWLVTRARLAPNQTGSAGQLQEWLEDWDLQAPERDHRHVSHLFGLFPGHDIDIRRTPVLAAAVRRSLELRGDQATGWATAWRINLWARLGDGDRAYEIREIPAQSGADLPEHVRRASAVPDRWQLRRHVGNSGDAGARGRRRDPPAAGTPVRVADGERHRAESARWFRDRSVVEEWQDRARHGALALGEPLRLRRGESQRTVARTTRGSALVFVGDDLRPVYE